MSQNPTHGHVIVDTRGMFCPVPIIKIAEAVKNLDSGGVVELIADDPAIELDLPAWCRSTGNAIRSLERDGADFHYFVEKR